jgi:hypothetical protein
MRRAKLAEYQCTLEKDECIRWLMNMLPNAFVQLSDPTSTTEHIHTPDRGASPPFCS